MRLPPPGREAPWDRLREVLARHGSILVYGWVTDWAPGGDDAGEPHRWLGRDWLRYRSLSPGPTQDRFLASRLLLRHAAAAAMRSTPDSIDLAYQPSGRPYLRGCDQIDINLSHTEEILVVGINGRGRIGVDVEPADRQLFGNEAEVRTCTPSEWQRLQALARPERNAELLRVWTLKEAFSKALGQGLRFRFTEFGFDLHGSQARLVRPDGSPTRKRGWTFRTWTVERRYLVSAATQATGFGEAADIAAGTVLDNGLMDAQRDAGNPG